jgi:hypothetical protein
VKKRICEKDHASRFQWREAGAWHRSEPYFRLKNGAPMPCMTGAPIQAAVRPTPLSNYQPAGSASALATGR